MVDERGTEMDGWMRGESCKRKERKKKKKGMSIGEM